MSEISSTSLFVGLDFVVRTLSLMMRERDPEAYQIFLEVLRSRLIDEKDLGIQLLLESYVNPPSPLPTFEVIQGGKDKPANSP